MSTIKSNITISAGGDQSFSIVGDEVIINKAFRHCLDYLLREVASTSAVDEPAECICGEKTPTLEDTLNAECVSLAKEVSKPVTLKVCNPPIQASIDIAEAAKKLSTVFKVTETKTLNKGLEKVTVEPTVPEDSVRKSYHGFLLIRCEHCGEVRGFMSRNEITYFRCEKCKGKTELYDLFPLVAKCECGKTWHYLTNLNVDTYEVNCINCGSPIPVAYNDRSDRYETMTDEVKKSASKKKKD